MTIRLRALLLAACLVVLSLGPIRAEATGPRLVLAHYMVCCPYPGPHGSVEAFEEEMSRALRHGIDGFVLNCGAWSREPKYLSVAEKMFAAADRFGGAFKLMFSADFVLHLSDEDAVDMMVRFRDRPSQYEHRGRTALATYAGAPARWESVRELARSKGFDPFIFANVRNFADRSLPGAFIQTPPQAVIDRIAEENPQLEGHLYFGAAGSTRQITAATRGFGRRWKEQGVAFMAPVTPYYRGHGPNNRLFDGQGFQGMAAQWEAAIEGGADLVQVVTWNDWGESSYVFPFEGPASDNVWKGHWGPLAAHDGFLEASRYYIDWFKSGHPPEARTDTISYFYIPHPRSLLPAGGGAPHEVAPRNAATLDERFHLFSNLSAEALVTLRNGTRTSEIRLPAGIHHASVDLAPGGLEIEAGGPGWLPERATLPAFGPMASRGSYNYLSRSLRLARERPAAP